MYLNIGKDEAEVDHSCNALKSFLCGLLAIKEIATEGMKHMQVYNDPFTTDEHAPWPRLLHPQQTGEMSVE